MKYLICFSLVFVVGCDSGPETRVSESNETYCTKNTATERSEFILQCIKNANPNSDEEPEDWIRQCQWMAEETICEKRTMVITEFRRGSGYVWQETSRTLKDQEQ